MHPKAQYVIYKLNQEKIKKIKAKQNKEIYLANLSAKLIKSDFKSQFKKGIIALIVFYGLMFFILRSI